MKLKRATSSTAYKSTQWVLKQEWLFDRAKYLLLVKQYNYQSMMSNKYALLNELDILTITFPKIYFDAWEDFFNDGLIR